MNEDIEENKPLINFPEKFPIKIFGLNSRYLEESVKIIISNHTENKDILDWHINKSTKAKYIAITVTIMAQSQSQLDDIYMQLTDSDCVTMAL